ncbi:peptide ABC transporter permease [Staphylococcus felis]|uniref:peptide MFS transporter n=1 Tax=Staphylococcus felis TaxID=46127 RepID=UPI000E222E9F|nr:peptide MFS transporter [Staphylococcus felis]REH77448.1 peptide ABC transporter permease [Staphylococcus felis]REH94349.1 peptide ABC transporter permease [Staphylococcus felis]REI02725.1 peptide ABC transporter permease [Staphylococcus felis]REI04241.1 peptide ABC transporter permease [Staphylococcus felis]REI10926.1 peptide ABC transporter permease [Staphylococcus felis]
MAHLSHEKAVQAIPQKGFFGHPRGLGVLYTVEFWERFSYYGMRALLIYYIYYNIGQGGLGLEKTFAQSLISIYGSLIFMTSILGGWVADRILGTRRSMVYGAILIIIGHICLSLPFALSGLLFSMFFIIIGSGLMKPNISNIVGRLYPEGDDRIDSGFVIFYMAVNMGAFVSPLILDHFRASGQFHGGFLIAAIGMAFSLLIYVLFHRKNLGQIGMVAPNPLSSDEKKKYRILFGGLTIIILLVLIIAYLTHTLSFDLVSLIVLILGLVLPISYFVIMIASKETTPTERSRVIAFIPLFIVGVIFWAIQEQGANVLNVYADEKANLAFHFLGLSGHFPITWFQSINPLFIVICAPVISWLWRRLGRFEPNLPLKFALGLFLAGLSFILMMAVIFSYGDKEIWFLWIILSYFICVIGELCISPTGSSSAVKLAPKVFNAQMMSLWLLTNATAQAINAQLVKLLPIVGYQSYFGIIGGIAIIVAILTVLGSPFILKAMKL